MNSMISSRETKNPVISNITALLRRSEKTWLFWSSFTPLESCHASPFYHSTNRSTSVFSGRLFIPLTHFDGTNGAPTIIKESNNVSDDAVKLSKKLNLRTTRKFPQAQQVYADYNLNATEVENETGRKSGCTDYGASTSV